MALTVQMSRSALREARRPVGEGAGAALSNVSVGVSKIAFREVTKSYPGAGRPAVNAVTFDVPPGVICMILGSSGSGKTTLLRMVNRLIEPPRGRS